MMQLREFKLDLLANLIELIACIMLIDIVRRFHQLRWAIRFFSDDNPVLHIAIGGHNNQQHALFG